MRVAPAVLLTALGCALLTGCDKAEDPRAAAARAASAAARDFTATYQLDNRTGADATVRVLHLGERWRIDVEQESTASRLLIGPDGASACQLPAEGHPGGITGCLLVAPPGGELPALFDPGIQRIFTTTLGTIASSATVTISKTTALPPARSLAGADCYRVSGANVDQGEYCLSDGGILRRAAFATGTLELQSYGEAPGPSAFVPPAEPTPLPG